MRQRIERIGWIGAWLACGLFLCCGALQAPAQQTSQGGSQAAAGPSAESADQPLLLLVAQRANAAEARDDATTNLLVTLRDVIEQSHRFRLLTYSPNQPIIKRALLEHQIAATDLGEPLSPEVQQRIARLVGAHDILAFGVNLDKTGLKTEPRLQESLGPQDWRIVFDDQITIPPTIGKKRLKPDEIVKLAADDIARHMGISSHLAENLHLKPDIRLQADTGREKSGSKSKSVPPSDAATSPESGNSGQFEPIAPVHGGDTQAGTPPTSGRVAVPSETDSGSTPGQSATGGHAAPTGRKPNRHNTNDATPPAGDNGFSAISTSTGPDGPQATVTPSVQPAAPPAGPDNAALAAHFRELGDLANVIVALRHAINERPHDMALRRELIRAYDDRGMPEAAMSEANRALLLEPQNAELRLVYGQTLLARGDMPGALAAFQEAARLSPGNPAAQVALGDALLADNQFAQAIDAYQAAGKTDPKSPVPHRRLARVFAARAAGDPAQYTASLDQIQQARALTPPADTDSYQEDYTALMRQMRSRLRDMLDQLQADYLDAAQNKRTGNELLRAAADLKDRAEAAADYLDKLPPAAGQDAAQAHYSQGAGLLLQAIGFFHDYITKPDPAGQTALTGAIVDARREIEAGDKRLAVTHPASNAKTQ